MSENLKAKINKASWKIRDTHDVLMESLLSKVNRISPRNRRKLPKFSGLWKEKNLNTYLERLQEAIDKPMMARSRTLIHGIGISSEGIPKEILENVGQIEEIVKLFNQLRKELGINADLLVKSEVLIGWLKEDSNEAKEKLQSIIDALAGFKRLAKLEGLNDKLRNQFFEKAFENFEFIGKADILNSQIIYICDFGIAIEYNTEDLEELLETCRIVYNALKEFEDIYKISTDEVSAWVKGKNLTEIREYLEGGKNPFSKEYARLIRRWRELVSVLREERQEPEGFPDLKKEIHSLETKFKKNLGEPGLRFLSFLRGDTDFPSDLSREDLMILLKKLQPFITIGLREENHG